MLGIQAHLAGLEAGRVHLDPLELLLRGLPALTRLGDLHRQARDLRAAGVEPGARGVDLSGEAGEALATVGRGPLGLRHAPLLRGRGALRRHAPGLRVRQRLAGRLHLPAELELLRPQRAGLRLDLLGVASGVLLLGLRLQVAHALRGELHQPVEPLAQAAQGEPGLLGRGEPGRVERGLLLGRRLLGEQGGELGVDLGLPVAQGGLVGDLGGQGLAQVHQVVGHDPQPRIAHLGLDHDGPAGHLGLPAQRLELAAQLGGEVLEAVEVGLHRLELAERLLLALAVLEDACRLLDDVAAVLGRRLEDRGRAGSARR